MARSTRAGNAVLRLKDRSQQAAYSMVNTANGLFYLVLAHADGSQETLCDALEMDAFVSFVNSIRPATVKKASKLDLAFEAQLQRSGKG